MTTKQIKRLRRARGLSQADMAQRLGIHVTNYSALERGLRRLTTERLHDIAAIFGVPAASLLDGAAPAEAAGAADVALMPGAAPNSPEPPRRGQIPVWGTQPCDDTANGFVFFGDQPLEYRVTPPRLAGAPGLYGFHVPRASMEPKHRRGDLMLAAPWWPARDGDTVAVHVREPDRWCLLHYSNRDGQAAYCRLNPYEPVSLDPDRVIAIHKILAIDDIL